MELARLAGWLRCPYCERPLLPSPPLSLRCAGGHAFDANKRGYVNLVAPGNRMIGDSPTMLDDRAAFLAKGHYSPIARAVAAAVGAGNGAHKRILDAGCGTGYYLASALDAHPDAVALAMDLSPEAVRRTGRQTGADGLVADTWRPLPVRSGACDVVIDVFAPRNLAEFHRVLAPAGRVIVVVPTGAHLRELRADGRAIGIPDDKVTSVGADAAELFSTSSVERVEYDMLLVPTSVALLVGMGPSAHHRDERVAADAERGEIPVFASVDVLTLVKR